MREIKFRVFNKVERRMCRVVSSNFIDMVTVRFPEFEGEAFSDDYNDEMQLNEFEPLLQYTGLKDKNGKEIYEGDIVEGISYSGHKTENQVTFLNGCYMFGNWNAHEFFNRHQYTEVIGNIYENPELSEEAK